MDQTVAQTTALYGAPPLPADKSLAHRLALFAALAEGTSELRNFPKAADPQSTLSCLRQLRMDMNLTDDVLQIRGFGLDGLYPSVPPLDCGNSGTTMRLLAGIMAAQPFPTTLMGDASLSQRPMARIAEPLRQMGAEITLTEGHAPILIQPSEGLTGITYRLPIASAQVKSAVLLAGLYAAGTTTVIEPISSRDHTERLLGLPVDVLDGERHIRATRRPIAPFTVTIPNDFSAAAFFLVAASILPNSILVLQDVGLNPTRTGLLEVLRDMGAKISVRNEREEHGEPIGDLVVESAPLHGTTVRGPIIPRLIDEIPILAVAAACAEGTTEIRDADELRHKETDRIAAITANLQALGVRATALADGLVIEGGAPLRGTTVAAFDDHRIAMAMGIAGLVAEGETTIKNAEYARISFPNFWKILKDLRQ